MDNIFAQRERHQFNRMTAKGILEKLMNIRQSINVEQTSRRLIWELIQNAKDNVQLSNLGDERVDINIFLEEDKFIFSHNKGYFTNDQTTGLIRKYSSEDKNRENGITDCKTTGRFGTGFMTTHLLSEIIHVDSTYKENDEFCKFGFTINRSGKTESEIIVGIEQAFNEAHNSIKLGISANENLLSTTFTYPLSTQTYKLAENAIKEVESCVAYTLINVPEIASIGINEELCGNITYSITNVSDIDFECDNIKLYNLRINNTSTNQYFICCYGDDVQIVLPLKKCDSVYNIAALSSLIPRLHLDFPMTGTEQLGIPFVINSYLFEPTEPRDGIALLGDVNDISMTNCDVITNAVKLYSKLIKIISDKTEFGDLFNLARVSEPQEQKWIDQDWFIDNITNVIKIKLLNSRIVNVCSGQRVSILDFLDYYQVLFPSAIDDETRGGIWKLLCKIQNNKTPIVEHIKEWDSIIWDQDAKVDLAWLSTFIEEQGNIESLTQTICGNDSDAISFLNDYYSLIHSDNNIVDQVNLGNYKVVPNQNGTFATVKDLYIDENINDEIKTACSIVSNDPREYLLHKNIYTGEGIRYHTKKQLDIVDDINQNFNSCLDNIKFECACYLTSLIPNNSKDENRQQLFNFSERIFPDNFCAKMSLDNFGDEIWKESDKYIIKCIVYAISKCNDTNTATEKFSFGSSNDFVVWLNKFVSYTVGAGFDNNINRTKAPVLPNQNGIFMTKDELFLDDGNIGEELKNIAFELGSDFREELLDTAIYLKLPENRVHGIDDVAKTISTEMKPLIRDTDKRMEHKSVLKTFYLWMDNNSGLAKKYFQDLYTTRFLFLDDDEIASNIRKADEVSQLLNDYNISSIDELRSKLTVINQVNSNNTHKIELTSEILAGLGVCSVEDLNKVMQDPDISQFYHSSTPSVEMFAYAQKLIERAKINVIKHLESLDEYDCSDMEETATTVLAGVVKNGTSINIVIRPSDSGEVIIYYESEKDTLDVEDTELWVDNGVTTPHLLTLGRILKSTGINRIPIRMD